MKHLSESIVSKKTGLYNSELPDKPDVKLWKKFLSARGFRESKIDLGYPSNSKFDSEKCPVFCCGKDAEGFDYMAFRYNENHSVFAIWGGDTMVSCDKNGNPGTGYWKETDSYDNFIAQVKEELDIR